MDELIQRLASQLGIDPSLAKTASEKAMSMIKDNAGDDLFGQIADKIPGASDAATSGAAAQPAGGGGMLGKLAGMASSALGGSAGGGIELGAALSESGLEADKVGGFVQMVVEFIKEKVGDEVLEQLLAKFPMLKTLIG
ncbi:DUF2780 domain-containing protein [Crateriforma conspicua]|uniref:DUF2267 domain-containing protein n=1 Tax=Crateriforma conspicua TaxID=2527996 RepID=A0A5C5Y3C7_9PLAN|nr:DUF2780 domain-containing protein [Crateriforma conspicua]TWT69644.1 hypothetical protein Pan14r_19340 [Crateriforma conspicua]